MMTAVEKPGSGTPCSGDNLVLSAMRLAEKAHRGQYRKAPEGEDRPIYFLHLSEVAWLLQDAGASKELIAAGWLHDVIEDCGYDRDSLAGEIGVENVADLVQWVSEPEKNHNDWHSRNQAYRSRLSSAPDEVLWLSCADKTANLLDTIRLMEKGYKVENFLSVGSADQLDKFRSLADIFKGRVPETLYRYYSDCLARFIILSGEDQ